jgi:hypothetical protein
VSDAGDKRRAPRRRILKGGIIAFNHMHSTLPCAVRDLSDTGAKLRVTGSMAPPDTFVLIIELDGIEVDCRVVWRKSPDLAVSFVSPLRKIARKREQVVTALVPERKPTLRRTPPSS